MASAKVLDEGMSRDDHPGAKVLFESSHRSQPRLQAAVIGLDVVVGVLLGAVPCRWEHVVHDDRYVAARSVTTSVGVTLVRPWPARRTGEPPVRRVVVT